MREKSRLHLFVKSVFMGVTFVSFFVMTHFHSHQESGLSVDQTHVCLACKIQNGFSASGLFNPPTEFFQNLLASNIVSNDQLLKYSPIIVLNFSRAPPR